MGGAVVTVPSDVGVGGVVVTVPSDVGAGGTVVTVPSDVRKSLCAYMIHDMISFIVSTIINHALPSLMLIG